ncbi:MAG: phosphoribosyl-AMP cyclohydrolase [Gallionella sp.]|jgi:phosphoribosyl-AMP cyclohydrolase
MKIQDAGCGMQDAAWLDKVKWQEDGLVPAIAQDAVTGRVLMVAWMNRDALQLTCQKNEAVYWSRSRNRLWHKGEESGHIQKVKEIRIDCDFDVILLQIEQQGGIACHTGRESCFFSKLVDGEWQEVDDVLKSPDEIYKKAASS